MSERDKNRGIEKGREGWRDRQITWRERERVEEKNSTHHIGSH